MLLTGGLARSGDVGVGVRAAFRGDRRRIEQRVRPRDPGVDHTRSDAVRTVEPGVTEFVVQPLPRQTQRERAAGVGRTEHTLRREHELLHTARRLVCDVESAVRLEPGQRTGTDVHDFDVPGIHSGLHVGALGPHHDPRRLRLDTPPPLVLHEHQAVVGRVRLDPVRTRRRELGQFEVAGLETPPGVPEIRDPPHRVRIAGTDRSDQVRHTRGLRGDVGRHQLGGAEQRPPAEVAAAGREHDRDVLGPGLAVDPFDVRVAGARGGVEHRHRTAVAGPGEAAAAGRPCEHEVVTRDRHPVRVDRRRVESVLHGE